MHEKKKKKKTSEDLELTGLSFRFTLKYLLDMIVTEGKYPISSFLLFSSILSASNLRGFGENRRGNGYPDGLQQ